jgi:hypothetical protein
MQMEKFELFYTGSFFRGAFADLFPVQNQYWGISGSSSLWADVFHENLVVELSLFYPMELNPVSIRELENDTGEIIS